MERIDVEVAWKGWNKDGYEDAIVEATRTYVGMVVSGGRDMSFEDACRIALGADGGRFYGVHTRDIDLMDERIFFGFVRKAAIYFCANHVVGLARRGLFADKSSVNDFKIIILTRYGQRLSRSELEKRFGSIFTRNMVET